MTELLNKTVTRQVRRARSCSGNLRPRPRPRRRRRRLRDVKLLVEAD